MSTLRRAKYFTENIFDKTIGRVLFHFVAKKDDMFNFHYNCLAHQHVSVFAKTSPQFHYYEFGVASGSSLENYIFALKKFCKDYNFDINKFHIHGFDSFEGMPKDQGESDKHPDWAKGEMSSTEELIYKKAKALSFPVKNIHLYKGFYEDSLTTELFEKLKNTPPALVNIDCDFYSSTKVALDWLRPMLSSGTIFRFDDYWSFNGSPVHGEIRAINEFNEDRSGHLAPFPILGLNSTVFAYSRCKFEYTGSEEDK